MTFTLTEVDFNGMSDEELQPFLLLSNRLDTETQPRHNGMTLQEFRALRIDAGDGPEPRGGI